MDSTLLPLAGAPPFPVTKTADFSSLNSPLLRFPLRHHSIRRSCSVNFNYRHHHPLQQPRLSPSALSSNVFASVSSSLGGGCGGDDGGYDGGGGGGGDGGDAEGKVVSGVLDGGESEECAADAVDDDAVIVLHVGGMSCKGCAGKVKRLLESQPQVSSATVDLEKETAFVWPVPEVKETEDWKQQLGVKLAQHLITCGFTSELKGNHATKGEESKQ